MDAASKETKHSGLVVNIISTPEDTAIQSSNKKTRCPHKMTYGAAPETIL